MSRTQMRQLRVGSRGEALELAIEVDELDVTRSAAERFAQVHGGDREASREGVRDTVEELLESGFHEEDERGYHVLFAEGYRVVVSPDLDAVVSYDTLHRERSLSEVREGVPSRFRGRGLSRAQLLAVDDAFIDEISVPRGVLADHLGDGEIEELRDEVRDAVADALEDEAVESSGSSFWLRGKEWEVRLRSDGKRVQEVRPLTQSASGAE